MLFLDHFSVILCLVSSQHIIVATNEVSSVKSLLELVSSTIDACGHVKWCTIQSENNVDPYDSKLKKGCCLHCSCNKSCLREQNCCPDYKLRNLLLDKPFLNVSHFTSELDKIGNISTDDIEIRYERNKTLDCVRSQLLNLSPHRPFSPSYRMITTCSNIQANAYLRKKCEDVKILTNSSVTYYLPIQSMESGIIYRNKYCLQCSDEPTAAALKWDLLLKCFSIPKGLLTYQISSMTDILVFMFQMDEHEFNCNLIFEPGKHLRQKYPPDVCTEIDVKTCRHNIVTKTHKNTSDICGNVANSQEVRNDCRNETDISRDMVNACRNETGISRDMVNECRNETDISRHMVNDCRNETDISRDMINDCRNETDISRDVVNACQNYFLPVYALINGKLTTFNNIACLSCNRLFDYSNLCYAFYKWQVLVPFVGRIQTKYVDENDAVDSNVKLPNVDDKQKLQCGRGFIYDSFTTQCRKLYCPCGMLKYMTTCVPIFENIQGGTNLIQVYITAQVQPIAKQKDFELKLFNHFSNSFDTNSRYSVKYIRLMKALVQKNRGNIEYITDFYFSVETPEVTFLETIKTVDKLFRGFKVIEAGTNLNVNMALKNDAMKVSNEAYSMVFQTGSMNQIAQRNVLIIRECNFCRRVELLPHDIKRQLQGFLISNTGHTILRQDITRVINDNTMRVVCARYVIRTTLEEKDYVAKQNLDADITKIQDPKEKSENWQKNNGFLYCIIVLVLIAGLVYVCLRFKKPNRLQGQTNTNDIEL